MDIWQETVVVASDSGMWKVTTPVARQPCMSQWRMHASHHLDINVHMVHCEYAYTCDLCFHKKEHSYMFMVISYFI